MNGYGSHTYKWYNQEGESFWVKYHFKTDQGVKKMTREEAEQLKGVDPDPRYTRPAQHHQKCGVPFLDASNANNAC